MPIVKDRRACFRIITLAVTLLTVSAADAQTAVIVFRNATEVVAAADSKIRPGPSERRTKVCKIFKLASGFYWTGAGIAESSENSFRLEAVAEKAAHKRSIVQSLFEFERLAQPLLEDHVAKIVRKRPDVMGIKEALVSIAFFGVENGIPTIASTSFQSSGNPLKRAEVVNRIILDLPTCPRNELVCGTILGNSEAAFRYQSTHRLGRDLVKIARKLIEVEIADVPEEVGPPINIVRISRAGVTWVSDEMNCQNTRQRR